MAILGDDTLASDTAWGDTGYMIGVKVTSGALGGTITSLHAYFENDDGASAHNVKMAVYTDDTGNNRPESQLAEEIEFSVDAGAYQEEFSGSYSAAINGSTDYWIVFIVDNSDLHVCIENDYGANTYAHDTAGSYDLPATADDSWVNSAQRYNMWAEYTEGGGGGSVVPIILSLRRRMGG